IQENQSGWVATQVITVTAMVMGEKDMGKDAINAMVLEQLLTKDAHVTDMVFE
ncbi:unnamed protein product, partial [Rotaria magnacalcarata]